jgi:hypothetical protein
MNPVYKFLWILPLRLNISFVHHGLYGLILLALALGLSYVQGVEGYISWILYIIGLALFTDDLFQHWIQVRNPSYHSVVHKIYAKVLWPIPWVQALNKWADKKMSSRKDKK